VHQAHATLQGERRRSARTMWWLWAGATRGSRRRSLQAEWALLPSCSPSTPPKSALSHATPPSGAPGSHSSCMRWMRLVALWEKLLTNPSFRNAHSTRRKAPLCGHSERKLTRLNIRALLNVMLRMLQTLSSLKATLLTCFLKAAAGPLAAL